MPRDTSDCIHISGMTPDVSKADISNHFCRAGTILVTKGEVTVKWDASNYWSLREYRAS